MTEPDDRFDEDLRARMRGAFTDIRRAQSQADSLREGESGGARQHASWSRTPLALLAAAAVAAAAIGVALHRAGSSSNPGAPASTAPPAYRVTVRVTIPGNRAAGLATIGGVAYCTVDSATRLERVDPGLGVYDTVATLQDSNLNAGIAQDAGLLADAGAIWMATTNHLLRIDAVSGAVIARLNVSGVSELHGLVESGGSLWAASSDTGTLVRIEPSSARVLATIQVATPSADAPEPVSVVAVGGALWVTSSADGGIERVDPATGRVTMSVHAGAPTADMTAGFGSLWVATTEGEVVRIDPANGATVASVQVPDAASVDAGAGGVWVATGNAGQVVRIDAGSNTVTDRVDVGPAVGQVVAGGRGVWALNGITPQVSYIQAAG